MRLYCFAYAGGSAGIFQAWQKALEPDVEVCGIELPGRGTRFREPPVSDMDFIVQHVAEAIAAESATPFAFFGHSLGALVAFEVARYCVRRAFTMPAHLFVSGCEAPRARSNERMLHLLPDEDLLQEIAKFEGTPSEVLANRELMKLMLPVLRADFRLAYEYEYHSQTILRLPMTVFAGLHDKNTDADDVLGWAEETAAETRIRWFDGGHFFINTHRDAVIDCVRSEMRKLAGVAVSY